MTNTVLLKRSSVANSVPQTGNLQHGELAINYTDGNLFYKNASNVVTTIASNKFTSVSGNVTGGNIVTGGVVTATGNITSTGNVSGNYVLGNGAALTGVVQTFVGNTTPVGARQGDSWINTDNGKMYVYFTDANGSQWAEMEAALSFSTTTSGSSYGDSNVVTLLASYGSNVVSTTGNVTAGYFIGNGSQLTGITAGTSNARAFGYTLVFGV